MTLIRTEEPGAEPVTLAEAKAHLRVSGTGEDGLIADLVRAAREEVERACGLALLQQKWRLVLDDWPENGVIELRRHPVRSVDAVTVYDDAGDGAAQPARCFRVDVHSRPARVLMVERAAVGSALNGIEVDFTAGFGEAATDVPDTLKRAVLMLVAHWFELRGGIAPGEQPASYPAGYDRLTAPFRERRI